MVETLEVGYKIEFLEIPRFRGVLSSQVPREESRSAILLKEVEDMLLKSAIRPVKGNPHEGFYSRIFLAPKKGGKWRPVINLKPLNQFIKKQKFKMATLQSTIQNVNAGDWLVSIDLKDAYFHVPIHPSHWKYLRFAVGNDKYEFMVLPFGITTAPRVFTKMMAPAAEYIRKEMGLYNSPYLDDFLMKDKERSFLILEVSGSDQLHARHRVGYQLGKVGNSTVSRSGSCRGQVQNISRNNDAPRGKSVESGKFSGNNTESTSGFSKRLLENVGSPQQLYISGRLGETVSETDPVISTGDVETEYGRSEGHDTNKAGTGGAFELVEVGRKSSIRLTPDATRSSTHPGDRCQYDGLGGIPRGRRRNQGDMVRGGVPETHKLAGDEGSLQQPDLFQESVVQENHDSDQVRQQDGGGISQQTGRNEVDLVLSDVGGAKLVQGTADSSESSLHQGSGKCSGRSSFQEGRSSRVVPLSGGGSESVPDLGEASGGSVRKRVEQQAGHILLEGERSGGVQDRRIESGLERPGNVCVSPRTSDPKSNSKSEIQHNKNDTSGFEQESETVDVSARRATVGHSKSSTSKGKVTKDAKLKSVPSGSRKPAFSCLDDRRRKLRQKGFRRGAVEMATGDIRKSTASCYSARVQAYVRWCNENGVKNPVGSSVASVCNLLYGLYEKGKAARTIGGYISAISKWHDRVHGKSLCEVPEVASFRKASVISRPPSQVNFNSWSLPLVLQRLTREPFEPLEGVPLKFLT